MLVTNGGRGVKKLADYPFHRPQKPLGCMKDFGGTMDDKDKNVIEQIVDTVNDFVESFANTAAEALDQAMEPSPVKLDEQPISDDATHGNDDGLRSEEEADTRKATTANSAVSVPAQDVKND
jgi:hypothetical protein